MKFRLGIFITLFATLALPALAEEAGETAAKGGLTPAMMWLLASPILAFLIIALISIFGTRKLSVAPRGMQNFLEFVVESLHSIPEMVMGPRGRQYTPFIASFFLYILVVNLTGLIPALRAGTSNLSITAGLGITAFIAVQYFGFKAHGWRYLLHFAGPIWWMAWLIMPLELLSELIRPVSLSLRLYGNIYGEDKVVEALADNFNPLVAVLMLPLQVLTSFLQALVFTLLVTVYTGMATQPHEGHEEHEEAEASAH